MFDDVVDDDGFLAVVQAYDGLGLDGVDDIVGEVEAFTVFEMNE